MCAVQVDPRAEAVSASWSGGDQFEASIANGGLEMEQVDEEVDRCGEVLKKKDWSRQFGR